jgi:WD40 repeat protein
MAELFRFAAFISYSSKDAAFARRLHRALEGYGIPASLGKFDLVGGGKANRIYPVFRDREELAAGRLGERIEASLNASAAMVVVCSPSSAASEWVEKEIEYFAGLGRSDRIFAIIADTAPLADASGADATSSCFPPAFRADALADATALEPLAADARKGKDGFRGAWLKLVAGLIGVSPGQIIDRDRRRRRRQRLLAACVTAGGVAVLATAAVAVDTQSMRSTFISRANVLTSQGRPLDAAAFALAGSPAPGDVIAITPAGADEAVLRTGMLVRIADVLGQREIDDFSEDGRFLETEAQDGTVLLRDLRSADPPITLGRVGAIGPGGAALSFSADGRFMAVRAPDGAVMLHDLHSRGPPTSLGDANAFYFSDDGRYLLLKAVGGVATLHALDSSGPVVPLGSVDTFAFSPDGRFLATRTAAGEGVLRDLGSGAAPISLGKLDDFAFSADGRLLVVDANHAGALRDPLGRGPALPLGWLDDSGFAFSANGRFLETRGQDKVSRVRDLSAGGAAVALGELREGGFAFSPDSRFMVVVPLQGPARLGQLGAGGRSISLGQTDNDTDLPSAGFSGDGRFLLTIATDHAASLRDLRSGGPPVPIGPLRSGGFELSTDGRFLLTWSPDDDGVLRDLSGPPPQPSGPSLRSQACGVSGDALPPFPARTRASGDLRGRPWNPCDWRGLFAILPAREAGDGWFEGVRQWTRLLSIRYFGGADWRCDEGASQAPPQVRERRRGMCLRGAQAATSAGAQHAG